jgi:hypothetical protein
MSGPMIAAVTVAVIFGFIFLIGISTRLEIWAGNFLERQNLFVKYMLLIPFLVLYILFRLIDIFVFICALFVGYQVATGVRNWWNRRDY